MCVRSSLPFLQGVSPAPRGQAEDRPANTLAFAFVLVTLLFILAFFSFLFFFCFLLFFFLLSFLSLFIVIPSSIQPLLHQEMVSAQLCQASVCIVSKPS